MRLRRCLFFAKCFAAGAVLRLVIFALIIVRKRLFLREPLLRSSQTLSDDYSSLRDVEENLSSYAPPDFGERMQVDPSVKRDQTKINMASGCSMSTCFNFSRCRGKPFKVHIYPSPTLESLLTAANDSSSVSAYAKILSSIISSDYYTSDPDKACLFVVAFDTLDRDLLSVDYVKNLNSKFASLPRSLWNGGENHLIFNLYSGTWPDYDVTDLGFDAGKAIMVKASFSVRNFRPFYDISFPLFHRILPMTTTDEANGLFQPLVSTGNYGNDAHRKRYLFSFKGKRYVQGIGSETRNSLYHLHDSGSESVVVTTCRHGKNWHQAKDERCDEDNESYDRWGSYEWLLSHSDFCLVPRGRRLGSYRFLEALQYGCVPTVLANEWELPFSEIVTWSEAIVTADERLLSTVPDALHEINPIKAFRLRQNAKELSQTYFASVDRIVSTTLQIIQRRLRPWEPSPLDSVNFEASLKSVSASPFFHAFITLASKRNAVAAKRLLDAVAASKFCSRITVLCVNCSVAKSAWPVPVTVVRLSVDTDWPLLPVSGDNGEKADSIFWIDASTSVVPFSTDEIDFAMQVWRWFPDRLVGFFTRRYQNAFGLSSKLLNDFTFLTGAGILYHKSYNGQLNSKLIGLPHEKRILCFDRLLNRLVMDEGHAPIKLTARYHRGKMAAEFVSDEDCFGVDWNSTKPARKSSRVRFDPLLYRDPVSNLRKKYKQMELANLK